MSGKRVAGILAPALAAALILAGCGEGGDAGTAHLATPTPCAPAVLPATPAPGATPTPVVYSGAETYLAEALNHIKRYSVRRDRFADWWAYHDRVMNLAGKPQTIPETYPAIRYALDQLCDNHSFFLEPEAAQSLAAGEGSGFGLMVVWPEQVVVEAASGGPAWAAGIRPGDRLLEVNGAPPLAVPGKPFVRLDEGQPGALRLASGKSGREFTVTLLPGSYRVERQATGRALPGNLAYLALPPFTGEGPEAAAFAGNVQALIADFDRAGFDRADFDRADFDRAGFDRAGFDRAAIGQDAPCGWVVDLRRNNGGNLWPMLLGLAPLLGDGWAGSLIDADGRVTRWMLQPDRLNLAGQPAVALEEGGYRLQRRRPPVAVLTSRLTGSAGEGVAVAFLSRGDTTFIGEATAGVASANRARQMPDGALLFVTTAFFADKSGQIYNGPILPDVTLAVDWTRLGSDDDPLLQAAGQWLRAQPACRGNG